MKLLKIKFLVTVAGALFLGVLPAAVIGQWDFSGNDMPPQARLHSSSGDSRLVSDGGEKFLRIVPGSHKEYVEFDVKNKSDLPKKFTLEAVFRPSGTAGSTMVIGKRYSPQYQLDYTSGGDGTFEFYLGGGDNEKHRASIGRLPSDGRWYHVVAVYDSTAKGHNQFLYINGKLVSSLRNVEPIAADQSALRLAENSNLNIPNPSGGDWQFAAIYDHAMTPAEVQEAFLKSTPGKSGKIVVPDKAVYMVSLDPDEFSAIGGQSAKQVFFNRFTGALEHSAGAVEAAGSTRKSGENQSIYLEVNGKAGQLHGQEWRNRMTPQLDLSQYRYVFMVVRASGLNRTHQLQPVISAITAGNTVLLNSSEVLQDGVYRTYWKKVKIDSPLQGIKLSIRTQNSNAFLEVAQIGFARSLKDIPQNQYPAGKFSGDLKPIYIAADAYNWSLSDNLNRRLDNADQAVVDPVSRFNSPVVTVSGIPFQVAAGSQNNLIRPKNTFNTVAAREVTVLGRKQRRSSYQPPSRNDAITVKVNLKGSELFFLLSTDLPSAANRYALPAAPRVINHADAFKVKLYYSDGSSSTAFPFQLKIKGYQISDFSGAYMVPLDPEKVLSKVEFVNKIPRHDIALAAVTINSSARRLYPQTVPELKAVPIPAEKTVEITGCKVAANGQTVVMENSYYKLELDFSNGFAVKSLYNKLTGEDIEFAAGSGVQISLKDAVFSGNAFKVSNLKTGADSVSFTLGGIQAIPAEFQLSISGSESAQIKFNASVIPQSNNAAIELCWPFFSELKTGELSDNGFFYPQYRNVLTTNEYFCIQPNHRGFTMQFFDLFNQTTGGGLLFMTDNSTQMPTWYAAGKNQLGMTGYIANRVDDLGGKSGQTLQLCERSITVHGGGWQRGMEYYRNWVNSWYKPVNAQDKTKFLNAFYIHVTASAPCDAGLWPFLIDQKSKKYNVKAYLDAVSKQFNRRPDIFHFYWWSYRPQGARNGEYGDKDYRTLIGGRTKFRKLIGELQDENMLVSLYTIWDRYDRDTEFYKRHGDKFVLQRPDGSLDMNNETIFTGVGGETRRAYAAKALKRLVNNVDNDVVYMDVFGTHWDERCINLRCGHRIPSWIAEDDGLFLQELRKSLPDTAIWSEYPVTDINSQYMDGNINYSALPLNEHMAKVYNRDDAAPQSGADMLVPDAYRFSFPRLKQIVFQVGQEGFIETWAYMKFNLFNGYALYDTTFWLYFEETRLNLAKTLDIQHEYKDCFLSEKPEMLVPTLVNGVYANCFPGKDRTLWTLFNGNFVSIDQPVIEVEHFPGARYVDVWNNRSLPVEIKGSKAVIKLKLDPHEVGCILQTR
ncbi:MAG: LamG domain-containing protein [Lentisphaerae bacterium]|nr:LamG domain-containing protein [Lentisphaerota bacterium]